MPAPSGGSQEKIMLEWNEYLKLFAGLFAVVDPIGVIPIFISLTSHQNAADRNYSALQAGFTVFGVLIAALLTGEALLQFFGISFASFRVAGGLLLLLMALSMVQAHISPARQNNEEAQDAETKPSIAVVPLGIPLLAGPGAISTVILYAQHSNSPLHYAIISGEIVLLALITWLCFRAAPWIGRVLGRTGINIVVRIMGLLIAALGIEFISAGLRQLFPVLGA